MNNDLIIPVYLNQRVVLDIMAMLRGGIATVTKITEKESQNEKQSTDVKAKVGLSNAFSSLFKVDLSGGLKVDTNDSESKIIGEERVHTPSSLFFSLRNLLLENELLHKDHKKLYS